MLKSFLFAGALSLFSLTANALPTKCNQNLSLDQLMSDANEVVFQMPGQVTVHNAGTSLTQPTKFQFRLKKVAGGLVAVSYENSWGRDTVYFTGSSMLELENTFHVSVWLPYSQNPGNSYITVAFAGNTAHVSDFGWQAPDNGNLGADPTYSSLAAPANACITVFDSTIIN